MKRLVKFIGIVTLYIFAVILLYLGAARLGKDARSIERHNALLRNSAGSCNFKRLYELRNKNLHDTLETTVKFTARIGPDSNDRIERKGLLVRRPHARATILICHGFTCSKDDVRFLRGAIFSEYTTLSFDFRGHGECTTHHICTLGETEKYDVIGAVEFIRSQPDLRNKPLIVYGFSMGAVASLLAAVERKGLFDAAIWDCPFDSSDKIIERLVGQLNISIAGYEFALPGRSLLQRYVYNSYVQDVLKRALRIRNVASSDVDLINTLLVPIDVTGAAKKIEIPAFIIVCKKDTKAPVEAAVSIYRNLQGGKQLWVTNGRGHFDSFLFNPEKYAYSVNHFIEEFLDGTISKHSADIVIDDPDQAHWKKIIGEMA